jgi:hypothetical protein
MFWREAAPRFAALLDEHARTGTPLPGETGPGGEGDAPAWSASMRLARTSCLMCKKASIV